MGLGFWGESCVWFCQSTPSWLAPSVDAYVDCFRRRFCAGLVSKNMPFKKHGFISLIGLYIVDGKFDHQRTLSSVFGN